MYLLKSCLVLLFLIVLVIACIAYVARCAKKRNKKMLKFVHVFTAVCLVLVTLLCVINFGDYTYPFERRLNPVLIAEFDVPTNYELEYPGQKFWHGAYEQFGFYAESFYFDPDNRDSIYGFGWPPMDFDRHCYIITYGQKILSLSYNVWETINEPIRTGAKVGHMTLDDDFMPARVYIYQIPKVRIENDINDITSPWD